MPDVYATIAEADDALGAPRRRRAARRDPQQRAMLEEYTASSRCRGRRAPRGRLRHRRRQPVPGHAPGVAHVTGVDPSPLFVERARELAGAAPVDFVVGDGRELELDDARFDAVVYHTTPLPRARLRARARRGTSRPAARRQLAVFDGDYATITLAVDASDPLQSCAEAVLEILVLRPVADAPHRALLVQAGFEDCRVRGHAYTSAWPGSDYFLALVDRGADALATAGKWDPPRRRRSSRRHGGGSRQARSSATSRTSARARAAP